MNSIDLFVKKLLTPYKYRLIKKNLKQKNFLTVLDVGCGARASEIARFSLNVKRFDGIDNQVWKGDDKSYQNIDTLYNIDVEKDNISTVPSNEYDVVIASHLIEHISNGEHLINDLCKKLKQGGLIYIETPSINTINLPSGEGFSNFYDDPTHKRIYFPHEIINVLMKNNLKVLKFGIRRDILRIILFSLPIILLNLIYFIPFKRKLFVKGLWDTLGIAQFWIARKVE